MSQRTRQNRSIAELAGTIGCLMLLVCLPSVATAGIPITGPAPLPIRVDSEVMQTESPAAGDEQTRQTDIVSLLVSLVQAFPLDRAARAEASDKPADSRQRDASKTRPPLASLSILADVAAAKLHDLAAVDEGALAWSGPRELADDEAYNVLVIGDSLGNGLHAGLRQQLGGYDRVNLIRETKRSSGLVNVGFHDWPEHVAKLVEQKRVDAAVVIFGANDRMNIVHDGDVLRLLGDEWKKEYGRRIDRFTEALTDAGAAVYWVGMPRVQPESFARKMKGINEVYRERARANRVRYISSWETTTDDEGDFRTHYHTDGGEERRLRLRDGVHFTWLGYGILAKPAADALVDDFGLEKEPEPTRISRSQSQPRRRHTRR